MMSLASRIDNMSKAGVGDAMPAKPKKGAAKAKGKAKSEKAVKEPAE